MAGFHIHPLRRAIALDGIAEHWLSQAQAVMIGAASIAAAHGVRAANFRQPPSGRSKSTACRL
jgi:hypothetical protein